MMDKKQEQALYNPAPSAKSRRDDIRLRQNELDPKCLDDRQPSFGMTNRGELIPCCWVDNQTNRFDKDYQQLISVSKIEDYDTIDEILLTDEWIKFSKNLAEGIGFLSCHQTCKKTEVAQHKRENWYEDDGFDFNDESIGTSKKTRIRET